ncbi:hypothetical protein [Streptomyces sioyaensis]|uniref:hypothetical protein n=1 Tax=Streptomyces sioyaensis TaxID=67364 RepID=UPI001F17C5F9|nr:hypothetical protein [Streptomyces sioyaensis]
MTTGFLAVCHDRRVNACAPVSKTSSAAAPSPSDPTAYEPGIDLDPTLITGRQACMHLLDRGILAKDTHGSTIRLAPPLVMEPSQLEWLCEQLGEVLTRPAS